MRVPGCGVPPPPDSRRFNSNNSQITDSTNDCNNNNNNNNNNDDDDDNVKEIGSAKSVEINWPIARGTNQREGITSGGCLEHHGTGWLTAETAPPTPLPPQRCNGRPLLFAEFFSRVACYRKFTAKSRRVGVGSRITTDPSKNRSTISRASRISSSTTAEVFRTRCSRASSWVSEVIGSV
ncbi:unnamed protein product [Heterotrigona itama]|uniref:Uncharacterized protein n=1 Tax=Heterotrigona itama TaxID=395501 RepID=A0A6V7HHE0_9HYME|nr:unnamed protein product [Heterotrigona itama]